MGLNNLPRTTVCKKTVDIPDVISQLPLLEDQIISKALRSGTESYVNELWNILRVISYYPDKII